MQMIFALIVYHCRRCSYRNKEKAMSTFTDDGAYAFVAPRLKQLTRDVTFYFNDDKTGEYAVLKKGSITNGISIPAPGSMLNTLKNIGFDTLDESTLLPADLHDELVGEHGPKLRVQPTGRILSWAEAALWFKKALQVKAMQYPDKLPKWKIGLYYRAVVVYGVWKGKK
jgi:hypothetical protein